MEPNPITGHFKDLTADEWKEAGEGFIRDTKQFIFQAKRITSMKDYFLGQAETALQLAERCFAEAKIS